jgi:quercetin dioxygenase-like cupin family protein
MTPRRNLAALAIAAVLTPALALGAPAPAARPRVVPQQDRDWKPLDPNQTVGGPTMSVLWGDPKKGPSGVLVRLPGEGEIPMHLHSAAYHAVLISGTWLHGFGTDEPVAMKPGDYWFQPARQPHLDRCRAGEDCVVLLHVLGKFDLRETRRSGNPQSPTTKPLR